MDDELPDDVTWGDSLSSDDYWLEADFLLHEIVRSFVNKVGLEIGVTLFLKGSILSGTLVSEADYLQRLTQVFRDRLRASMPPGEVDIDQDLMLNAIDFTLMAESSTPEMPGVDGEVENDESSFVLEPVRFLHLRDVNLLSPYPTMSFHTAIVPIMRVRLNAIDGWFLGQALDGGSSDDNAAPRDGGSDGEVLH